MCDAVDSSRRCTHAHEPKRRSTVRGCHNESKKLDVRPFYRGGLAVLTAAVVVVLEQRQQPDVNIIEMIHHNYTGWFRLNAQNCVPGNSSRRFFELDHEILHTYSGRQHLKLEEGGFFIWGFAVEISGF